MYSKSIKKTMYKKLENVGMHSPKNLKHSHPIPPDYQGQTQIQTNPKKDGSTRKRTRTFQ